MSPYGENIMYVYLIQSGNKPKSPVKVGMSNNPEKRIKQLQTGNPVLLRLVLSIKCESRSHAFRLEKTMHELLKGNNIINEWYSVVRSNIYKSLNVLANNPDYENVVNNIGLFASMSVEDKIEQKAKKRLNQLIYFGEKEQRLIDKNKRKDIEIEDMLEKLRKRKREAQLLRLKLHEFGFNHLMIDELLGRK